MKYSLITFRSVTPAQRGESILRKHGIRCFIRRTPRWMEEQGCGYSLQLDMQDVVRGIKVLTDNEIPFRKAYRIGDNGRGEEWIL